MSTEQFLISTVNNIKTEHKIILNTPRGRATRELIGEIEEFKDYCGWPLRGGKLKRNFIKFKKNVNNIKKLLIRHVDMLR